VPFVIKSWGFDSEALVFVSAIKNTDSRTSTDQSALDCFTSTADLVERRFSQIKPFRLQKISFRHLLPLPHALNPLRANRVTLPTRTGLKEPVPGQAGARSGRIPAPPVSTAVRSKTQTSLSSYKWCLTNTENGTRVIFNAETQRRRDFQAVCQHSDFFASLCLCVEFVTFFSRDVADESDRPSSGQVRATSRDRARRDGDRIPGPRPYVGAPGGGQIVKYFPSRLFGISRGHGIGLLNLLGLPRKEPEQVQDSDTLPMRTPGALPPLTTTLFKSP